MLLLRLLLMRVHLVEVRIIVLQMLWREQRLRRTFSDQPHSSPSIRDTCKQQTRFISSCHTPTSDHHQNPLLDQTASPNTQHEVDCELYLPKLPRK